MDGKKGKQFKWLFRVSSGDIDFSIEFDERTVSAQKYGSLRRAEKQQYDCTTIQTEVIFLHNDSRIFNRKPCCNVESVQFTSSYRNFAAV